MKDQQNTDSKDARRYRFLREKAFHSFSARGGWLELHYSYKQQVKSTKPAPDDLDMAIDEQMKGGAK